VQLMEEAGQAEMRNRCNGSTTFFPPGSEPSPAQLAEIERLRNEVTRAQNNLRETANPSHSPSELLQREMALAAANRALAVKVNLVSHFGNTSLEEIIARVAEHGLTPEQRASPLLIAVLNQHVGDNIGGVSVERFNNPARYEMYLEVIRHIDPTGELRRATSQYPPIPEGPEAPLPLAQVSNGAPITGARIVTGEQLIGTAINYLNEQFRRIAEQSRRVALPVAETDVAAARPVGGVGQGTGYTV